MARVSARRRAAWLLSVPMMFAGSQVAHVFAYRLAYPDSQVRDRVLAETGHRYLTYMPFVLGACGAVVLVSIGWVVISAAGNRRHTPAPPWAFALLPVIAFATQEAVERAFAGVLDPWSLLLEPTFRVGVLLQAPFAIVVLCLAWLLLRVAETIGAGLRSRSAEWDGSPEAPGWFAVSVLLSLRGELADRHAGRGPPRRVSASA
jgi:hypothetical protein